MKKDRTVINIRDKKVLHFSIEDFERKIVNDDSCFLCGLPPTSKKFNNEHIIPNWILKRFNLHNDEIFLPNLSTIKYGSYTIPCCVECNSYLADKLETPISKIFEKDYEGVSKHIRDNGCNILFVWLSLIFFKIHLKDTKLRLHRDTRMPNIKIGDNYFWESMHHIHCIARSPYTNSVLGEGSIGSFFLLPAKTGPLFSPFDYGDLFPGKSIFIKINDVCIVAVLNDSCAALSVYLNEVKKIKGPLSPLQYREIMARLAHINICLSDRPIFSSHFGGPNKHVISAKIPAELKYDLSKGAFGRLHFSTIRDIIERIDFEEKNILISLIKEGRWTSLFNNNDEFMDIEF